MSAEDAPTTPLYAAKLMLEQDAEIFERYARNHRAKIGPWEDERSTILGTRRGNELDKLIVDTAMKAEANERRAAEIRSFLAQLG